MLMRVSAISSGRFFLRTSQSRSKRRAQVQRNFSISDSVAPAVWVESNNLLHTQHEKLRAEQPRPNLYAVRGSIKDAELSDIMVLGRRQR